MSMDLEHPSDEIQELLDGRLSEEARASLEAHLLGCARCGRERDILALVRSRTSLGFVDPQLPPGLHDRLRRALDAGTASEARTELPAVAMRPRRFPRILWPAFGVVALLVTILVYGRLAHRPADVIQLAARDLQDYSTGEIQLQFQTSDAREMSRYFETSGVRFPTRVFDLSMMGVRLVGGSVHRLSDRSAALFVYRQTSGAVVLCQMYEGRISDLPAPDEVRNNAGIAFQVYESEGANLVFWEEGPVVCVLASNLPRKDLLDLAFAKAMKV